MAIRRLMVSAVLAGATLMAAAPFAAARHADAGKTVTVKGDGFSIQFPSTWNVQARLPLTQVFHQPALQKLAKTAVAGVTADGIDNVIVFLQHASLKASAIEQIEGSMFKDGETGKVVKGPTYNVQSNGVVTGTLVSKYTSKGKTIIYGLGVIAKSSGGSTLYALLTVAQGYAADSQEVSTAIATLK